MYLVLWQLCAAIVGALTCRFEAITGGCGLPGIVPPPSATRVLLSPRLFLRLAMLWLTRLIRNRRPLALLEMTWQLCVVSVVVTVPVPVMIRCRQLVKVGLSVLPKVIVPVVTMRTSGLFRALGKISDRSPPLTLGPVPVRTTLLCGLCSAPRAAEAMMLVRGIGPGQMLVVIRFVMRVTLMMKRVLIDPVTVVTCV